MQSRNPNNMQGCDLSHYQSGIDVKSTPGTVVYLKASEGQHTKDPAFNDLYAKCRAAGKKIGAYHFFHVGGSYSVQPQVDNAASVLQGKQLDCLFAIDIEDDGYHGGTPQQVTAQILQFADNFKAKTGIPCCVYSNTYFIKQHFTPEIKRLPLWVAHYGVNTPGDNGIWDKWAGFQYTNKPYDLDEFTTDILINNAPAAKPTAVNTFADSTSRNKVYEVPASSLPCEWNSTAGANFDVRTADGKVVKGRQVYKGDRIIILSVNYDTQLAEVLYPAKSCWVHGWIRNLQNLLHNRWHYKWHNGSTNEPVYGSPSGNDRIGTIFPYEKATPLYPAGKRYALLYNTKKGMETKFGYVDYKDGFKF